MGEKQQNKREEIEKRKGNFCKKGNSTYYTSTDVTADFSAERSHWVHSEAQPLINRSRIRLAYSFRSKNIH